MAEHPNFVCTNGSWNDIVERLFLVFSSFFDQKPQFKNKKIRYNTRQSEGKPEGFWHVTSRKVTDDREFDPRRSERIGWIKSFVEDTCSGVSAFAHTDKDGTTKYHFWHEEDKYVVIFAEVGASLNLVTAFYVDQKGTLLTLKKKRKKRNSTIKLEPLTACVSGS